MICLTKISYQNIQFIYYLQQIIKYILVIVLISLLLNYFYLVGEQQRNKNRGWLFSNCSATSKKTCEKTIQQYQTQNINKINDQGNNDITLISVLGGPGSGKGTQCAYLHNNFGFKHISLGDLFRHQLKVQGPLASQINKYMKQGKLAPSQIGVKLIVKQLQKLRNGQTVLLDGFPRNRQNIEVWQRINGDRFKIKKYLLIDCPLQVMEKRLLQRGKNSGRPDDNAQTIRKRLELFISQTKQIISQIQKCQQCTLIKIQGNKQIDQIAKNVSQKFVDIGYKTIK